MARTFLRRSLLYVPGSSAKMMEKALSFAADGFIFDLEDAVSPLEKESARSGVAAFLPKAKAVGKEVLVRVNAVNTALGVKDLLAIAPLQPDTIIVPKADVTAIVVADTVLGALEQERGLPLGSIGLIPLMETAESIVSAAQIVNAANRVNGVQFGAEDLTKELGIVRTARGEELWHARSVLVFAGRARGIDILDTPFADHANEAALITETEHVKALGMTGKTCIHPTQVGPVNDVFTPKPEQIVQARRILVAFEAAVREGRGACALDGKMIDAPIAARARKLIDKADRIGGGCNTTE